MSQQDIRPPNSRAYRINTGMKNDVEFQVNSDKFFGVPTDPEKGYYKNYRNFFRGETPQTGSGQFKSNLANNASQILSNVQAHAAFDQPPV